MGNVDVRGYGTSSDGFATSGAYDEIEGARRTVTNRRRNRPPWAKDYRSIVSHLLQNHPNFARRARVLELYYLHNWPASRISKVLCKKIRTVESIIYDAKIRD